MIMVSIPRTKRVVKGCLGPRYRPPYMGGDVFPNAQEKNRWKRIFVLVSGEGLEPSSLSAPDPKSGVVANFTTPTQAFGSAQKLFYHFFTFFQ